MADKAYSRAKCMLDSVTAYELRHMGISLEDIGRRYGLTEDGARYRVQKVEKALADGTLDKKVRAAKDILKKYEIPVQVCVTLTPERLPVKSISGARFSPLY